MAEAHVDLVEVGTATVTEPSDGTFVDTGIVLPPAGFDALVARIETRTTGLFSEERLTGLAAAEPGDQSIVQSDFDAENALPLNEIGVSLDPNSRRLGHTVAAVGEPRGRLLLASSRSGAATDVSVTLWHLEPAAVGIAELDAATASRQAPVPTEATRGRYLRQSATGEVLEFAEDPPADPGDLYTTVAQYRGRTGAKESVVSDEVLLDAFGTVARHIDRRLGWAPGALGPIPGERTLTFWPGRRPNRVLYLRDAEGHVWPLRSWTSIACDYSGRGTPETTITADDDWVVGLPGGDRPYRALRILEAHADAVEAVWPADPGSVAVTSTEWGHARVVGAARDLVIYVTRAVLDSQAAGAAGMVKVFESVVSTNDQAARLWRLLEMEASAGRPGRLGVVTSAAARRR